MKTPKIIASYTYTYHGLVAVSCISFNTCKSSLVPSPLLLCYDSLKPVFFKTNWSANPSFRSFLLPWPGHTLFHFSFETNTFHYHIAFSFPSNSSFTLHNTLKKLLLHSASDPIVFTYFFLCFCFTTVVYKSLSYAYHTSIFDCNTTNTTVNTETISEILWYVIM